MAKTKRARSQNDAFELFTEFIGKASRDMIVLQSVKLSKIYAEVYNSHGYQRDIWKVSEEFCSKLSIKLVPLEEGSISDACKEGVFVGDASRNDVIRLKKLDKGLHLFILLHEVGHILLHHRTGRGNTLEKWQLELEADLLATVMCIMFWPEHKEHFYTILYSNPFTEAKLQEFKILANTPKNLRDKV